MALDKLVDSAQLDADLASVADAIRAKSGGSASLSFPAGFVSEIGAISGGGLPSGYTACNYIQSNGDAYIDTGISEIAGILTELEGGFDSGNPSALQHGRDFFGYQGNPVGTYRVLVFLSADNDLYYYGAASGSGLLSGYVGGQENMIKFSFMDNATYPVITINQTTSVGTKKKTATVSDQGSIYLFAQNYQGTGARGSDFTVDSFYTRCYGFKMSYCGAVVRNFLPCVRDADGVAGFWETQTESFFPSIGTEAFSYG